MIVFAAKVSVRKIVVGVLAVGLVLVGAAALLPKTAEADTAVSAEGAALSAKLKTNEDRVALLTACGWSVESEPVGTQEVQIPDTFDEVYEQYNAIQQAQGLDLTPYQGKRATLYTYALTAYPTGEQGVTANLLVRRNRLIAADITSAQTDGFVHGLLDMPQTSQRRAMTSGNCITVQFNEKVIIGLWYLLVTFGGLHFFCI